MIVIKIKKGFLLLFFAFFCSQIAISQNIEFKNANFKSDKKGLKAAQKDIKKGNEYRESALADFLSMQDPNIEAEYSYFYYKKAYEFNPNNAILNYKIASVLLFTNRKEFAKKYLDNSAVDEAPSTS